MNPDPAILAVSQAVSAATHMQVAIVAVPASIWAVVQAL